MANVKELLANFVHIGHRGERWNPRMKSFLAGKKDRVYIFDLEQTAERLEKACAFLKGLKIQNKKVLFVGTKPQTQFVIQQLIADTDFYYVDKKWTPGLLTNFKELRRRIDFYLKLKDQFATGDINKYTKKEVAAFKKELDKLDQSYGGVAEMRQRPDAVIVLDSFIDRIAIDEANKANIATVAIADANANPDGIDYLIPGNDDSLQSLNLFVTEFLNAMKK